MSAKKKTAATAAAVLIVALLLGGAFAWTDFSQAFKNLFHGTATPDVLLHDDFAPGKNKDVYVENTGDVPLVVRVQFAEFLQVGNDLKIGTDAKDSSTWRIRTWAGTTIAADGTVAANDNLHNWLMSGGQKWYLPGTSEIGDVEYTGAVTGGNGNTTKETLTSAPVILLSEYQKDQTTQAKYDADNPDGFWILDDSASGNGWCYWSKLLPAGEATNLLLDNVTVDPANKPDDNYAYNIDVRLQAANETEAYKLGENGDISDVAKKLTNNILGVVTISNPNNDLDGGSDGLLFLKQVGSNPDIYEILDDNGKSLNPKQYIADPDGDIANNGTLPPNAKPFVGVKGQDGLYYVDNGDGTYTNATNNLTVTPPKGQLPGGTKDIVQTPNFPYDIQAQNIMFRVLPIPTQVPGSTYQIQLEFVDPSQEAAAKPLRYVPDAASLGNFSIDQNGLITITSSAAVNSSIYFYVIAADGSYAPGSVYIGPSSILTDSNYIATGFNTPIAPTYVEKGQGKAISCLPNQYQNVTGYSYQIQGADLGCTLTPDGWFTAGTTSGTVTVQVTVSAKNYSTTSSISVTDDRGTNTIAPGQDYTLVTTFSVIIPDALSAEAPPLITQMSVMNSTLGINNWANVEPAPAYGGGTGSKADPYKISSLRQLKKLQNDIAMNGPVFTYQKYFTMTANMDFDGSASVGGTLLGNFYGSFDGQDHAINGLTSNQGLFTTLAYGTVQNLGRTGGIVNSLTNTSVGAIAGTLSTNASMVRCYNETPIGGSGVNIGGLVCATLGSVTIDNCYNAGTIQSTSPISGFMLGGLVGFAKNNAGTLTVKDSYNVGGLTYSGTTTGSLGGIIGTLHNAVPDGQTIVLDNVHNYGRVEKGSTNCSLGGIIGSLWNPISGGFDIVNMNSVSYLPNQLISAGSPTTDTDIGNRATANPGTGGSITVDGSLTNQVPTMPAGTPTPTGFLVP